MSEEQTDVIDYLMLGEFVLNEARYSPYRVIITDKDEDSALICYYENHFGEEKPYKFPINRLRGLKIKSILPCGSILFHE